MTGFFGGASAGVIGAGDASVAVLYDWGRDDGFAALDGQVSKGLQATADLGAGIIFAPFANAEDLGGLSHRLSLRWFWAVDIAIPDGKWWATSITIDFVPGFDFGFGVGPGYTKVFGVDEPCD
ncbi:MAG: hypothetical protein HUN04_00540 [Desulfobacter sp.]|nr:MAG: hypothetical protein HUN04_00540 [Desulfobacter sp.]